MPCSRTFRSACFIGAIHLHIVPLTTKLEKKFEKRFFTHQREDEKNKHQSAGGQTKVIIDKRSENSKKVIGGIHSGGNEGQQQREGKCLFL